MVVAVVIFRSVSALSRELFKLKSENCMNNKLKMKCKDNQYLAFPDFSVFVYCFRAYTEMSDCFHDVAILQFIADLRQ